MMEATTDISYSLYKEDFNKFAKALNEAVDYVKTELMPDFDFDAFNHEYPENASIAEETQVEIEIEAEDIIVPGTTTEDVDKW